MARIEKSIEVNVPVSTAYRQMTRFTEFPRFMEGVREVRQLDATHLHWRAASADGDAEWDSEITQQVPDTCIAWTNLNGRTNTGRVDFSPAGPDRARLTLVMEIAPQGTPDQAREIEERVAAHTEQNLARFKKMVEAAERDDGATSAQSAQSSQSSRFSQTTHGSPRTGPRPGRLARPGGMLDEPFVVMRKVGEEMDHLFERFIGAPLGIAQRTRDTRGWTPQVEVTQHGDEVVVCADLPGIKAGDVQVEVRRSRLTIEGERHAHHQPQDQRLHRSECLYGHFHRDIPLPEDADADAATASMHDGVLEIRVPMLPETQRSRRLHIRTQD